MNDSSERAIAIVGLGAILPDAPNVAAFWQNILNKRYSISEVPTNRWSANGDSLADYYDPDPKTPDKTYSKIGGWVRDFQFDWKRFRLPPKVAAAMDQGQQWALTIAADALADYGYPERPLDTDRTAVVLGTAMGGELHYLTNLRINFPEFANALKNVTEFAQLPADLRRTILERWHETIDQQIPGISEDSMPGELPNIVSGRVANVLNLRGPNFITDAACASSFAAVDAAMELLTEHKVDAVVTGGVDRNMGIGSFVKFCKIGALSATGTRPFGDGADGFVMGEGAGAFLLKRLEDAERAGDKIYAVIRGVGGASDGKGKGITAPNPIGQQLAMQRAWEQAGLDPATATLVEAHGTSTRVGDVVEVESLNKIFGAAKPGSIGLGSVKSNIGHLKAGAGAAGLLKAALALHYKILPPTLNSEKPNPNIDFAHSPFTLIHQPREWQANGTPRRCGVSAYGFGGTNFHLALEEYVPGMVKKQYAVGSKQYSVNSEQLTVNSEQSSIHLQPKVVITPSPVRGILAIGAKTAQALKEQLDGVVQRVDGGWTPAVALPNTAVLTSPERLLIDFGDHEELLDKVHKAQKAAGFDNPQAWKALQAQGIFRGSGPKPGKVVFLFPGQGSQYVNMGKELAKLSPVVAEVFAEADRVMTPILGKPLTDYIFVEPEQVVMAEMELMQTAVTQPAMLTLDTAIYKLLASYGFAPDMVMGHSLGEYASLIAADIMPFADALEAAAARGSEMSKVSVGDNGKMAAVLAPIDVVEQTLKEVGGYVVPANINSHSQAVIGGASQDVDRAVEVFTEKGFRAIPLPVSHAFHTNIVAPASAPLRQVLNRLHIAQPRLQMVANVTGDFYPQTVEEIKDILQQQIASPVQWVKGLETLYAAGVRTFVEVGPKKALKGFVDDVLGKKSEIISLFTNHPKTGELASFNQAICGLYAAGYGGEVAVSYQPSAISSQQLAVNSEQWTVNSKQLERNEDMKPGNGFAPVGTPELGQLLTQLLSYQLPNHRPYDRNEPPLGSVVMTGAGLGLPGAEKAVMDPENAMRILRGEQFVDLIPERFRKRILAKRVTRLVKSEDGNGRFETITNPDEVIKLAGRPGYFDLTAEYGVPAKLVEALDMTTQLAMAAGLDALREAGIPLVQTFRRTSTGKFLPDRWLLPEALRDETGVIFASAFPGGDRFADEFGRYYTYQNRLDQLNMLQDFRRYCNDGDTLREIDRRTADLRDTLAREPYEFDRRFLFRILAMGHSQFAEYIGARGPNTQVNAACASTAQGIAIAEDWIRSGRCRRVVVIGADNVTGDHLMEWVGAGFLATGAAATDDRVEEAALPFDRRRHGTIIGMGACALVLESEDAVRERGMRGIVELLSSETSNSAFHGTRLDVTHISQVMDNLLKTAEYRFGLDRRTMAGQMVFMSHETFTPARGGSASAEVYALRSTFGEAASEIVMANTKGFTGHPMGVGVEDVIALKILEYGIVPPVPNFKEVDPDLGRLNLSRGGRYPVQYALHLAAGFGSQIAMTLTRRIPGALDRVENKPLYQRWLDDVSGYDRTELEVEKRVLRVKSAGAPGRSPVASSWRYGMGPAVRTLGISEQRTVNSTQYAVPSIQYSVPNVQQPTANYQPVEKVEERGARSEEREAKAEPPISNLQSPITQLPSYPVTQLPAADDIQTKVMQIVAAQTGYPVDMLDPELDMEADLGIDTVKQAETFAAIRKAFDIPRRDDLKLRDYPTLKRVVEFVKENSVQYSVNSEQSTVNSTQYSVPSTQLEDHPLGTDHRVLSTSDTVLAKVLEIVAAQTGYPVEMLEPDLDMEADLGIDTVKQAETFAAIRKAFDIPRRDDLKLRDYPTLKRVVEFVKENSQQPLAISYQPLAISYQQGEDGRGAKSEERGAKEESPISNLQSPADGILAKVLEIVAAQTGYPVEMLEPDLDMEADLGIDTVKQAETFAAIRKAFDIPRRDDLKLRDYPTLRRVVEFVEENRVQDSVNSEQSTVNSTQYSVPSTQLEDRPLDTDHWVLSKANEVPRRVPTPTLRPFLNLCKPTGVTLNKQSRVVIMPDKGGVGQALNAQLQAMGAATLMLEESPMSDMLELEIRNWMMSGFIQGVYWLPALDAEPTLDEMSLAQWQEANRLRVKDLYFVMRTLYSVMTLPNNFLVSATRLGGLHGYGPDGATAPLGGAVTGFTKAFKRERPNPLVKAVDFGATDPDSIAKALIAETLSDPGVVEVGYWENGRYSITLTTQPIDLESGRINSQQPGTGSSVQSRPASAGEESAQADLATVGAVSTAVLNKDTVFVITGAAGGITSAIVEDLAAASGGVFYLLDLVAAPDPKDEHIALFRQDKEGLKQRLIEEAKAAGEKPTPAVIDKKIMAVERAEAALRAVETVQAAGGTAHYYSADLRDETAVSAIIADIRQKNGRVDVLVHAAGLEISRSLADKDPNQFNLVFDVKADGFFNLLHAAKGMPIGATIAFSSVAGRFGNNGQTDYSAANDLLCKLTSSLKQWRPGTRGIVIDWTAWGQIGMATRGSIPKIMEMAGIDMLRPEVGVPTVRRELLYSPGQEVVVAGKLGVMVEEFDGTGGLDLAKTAEFLAAQTPPFVMVGQVKAAKLYGGMEVETTLDPKEQPFLYDHAMDGVPLLPGVMGTETFAQLATVLAAGYGITAVENEQFHRAFKLFKMQPQTLYLTMTVQPVGNGELLAHGELRSRLVKPDQSVQEKLHFSADVRLNRTRMNADEHKSEGFASPTDWPIGPEAIYKVYFHGPAYQVVAGVVVDGETAVGQMTANLPPNTHPAEAASVMAPRLIELCFQTAGVWEIKSKGVMALPAFVGQVSAYHQPVADKTYYALVQAINNGESFNAQVVDETGTIYVDLVNYRTVQLPGSVQL